MVTTLTKTAIKKLIKQAEAAGLVAGNAATPVGMVVGTPTTPLGNDIDYNKPVYNVPEGPCGFAWIDVYPGNSRLANVLKAAGKARKNYGRGGVSVWVREFGQSMARKEAYAGAYAKTLRDAGFDKVYAGSRMD